MHKHDHNPGRKNVGVRAIVCYFPIQPWSVVMSFPTSVSTRSSIVSYSVSCDLVVPIYALTILTCYVFIARVLLSRSNLIWYASKFRCPEIRADASAYPVPTQCKQRATEMALTGCRICIGAISPKKRHPISSMPENCFVAILYPRTDPVSFIFIPALFFCRIWKSPLN